MLQVTPWSAMSFWNCSLLYRLLPNGSALREPLNLLLVDLTRTPWFDDVMTNYLGQN